MSDPVPKTTDDRFTADAFAAQREAAWDWVKALGGMPRAEFDARYDEQLAEMRAEEATNDKQS